MADPADNEPEIASPVAAEDDDAGSLVERVKDLADDTRTAIEAELAWQGARAGYTARKASGIAVWGGLALACVTIALLAVAFGAILTLAPRIGPGLATAVVSGVLLIAALVAALLARRGVRHLLSDLAPPKPEGNP